VEGSDQDKFEALSWHLSAVAEENHKAVNSGYSMV
jgi:hypothetical protein